MLTNLQPICAAIDRKIGNQCDDRYPHTHTRQTFCELSRKHLGNSVRDATSVLSWSVASWKMLKIAQDTVFVLFCFFFFVFFFFFFFFFAFGFSASLCKANVRFVVKCKWAGGCWEKRCNSCNARKVQNIEEETPGGKVNICCVSRKRAHTWHKIISCAKKGSCAQLTLPRNTTYPLMVTHGRLDQISSSPHVDFSLQGPQLNWTALVQ